MGLGGGPEEVTVLNYQERVWRLDTSPDYCQRLPLELCGHVMAETAPLLPYSLRMALEGASVSRGRRPAWLKRASDVRFVDYASEGDATLLCLAAPPLGEAAEELYRQQELWDTRPPPEQTAVDLFSRVAEEVASGDAESDWFDEPLLQAVAGLKRLFSEHLRAVRLPGVSSGQGAPGEPVLDRGVVETARTLSGTTPPNRQVRVAGKLDMIRHSTRTFGLRLDDGSEVRGVAESYGLVESLARRFGERVLVLGEAVYRPSGRLLRIDAKAVEEGAEQPPVFAKIPPPRAERAAPVAEKAGAGRKRGVAAFFGIWPGDETDADFEAMLREVRG